MAGRLAIEHRKRAAANEWPAEFNTPAKLLAYLREECGFEADHIVSCVEYMLERHREQEKERVRAHRSVDLSSL